MNSRNAFFRAQTTNYQYMKQVRKANGIVMWISLIFYFLLMIASLVSYLLSDYTAFSSAILFFASGALLLCQLFSFGRLKCSARYGYLTIFLFAAIFTYINIVTKNYITLILLIPFLSLCILYCDTVLLLIIDAVWILNAVIKLIVMLNAPDTSGAEYTAYTMLLLVCTLFAVSILLVSRTLFCCFHNLCHSLKQESTIHKQLYTKSSYDSTTGLLNRNSYNEYVSHYTGAGLSSLCCIYIDVNGLHEYNNTYGHQAGDKMLHTVAATLTDCFHSHKIYRIGGDEFVIICENSPFKSTLAKLQEFRTHMKKNHIYIATGMEWREENLYLDEMIKTADEKMFQDKERFYKIYPSGRNASPIYDKLVE